MPTKGKATRECPFCWEEILATAKKCRFCWERFEEKENKNKIVETDNNTIKEKSNKPFVKKSYWKNWLVKWFWLALTFLFFYLVGESGRNNPSNWLYTLILLILIRKTYTVFAAKLIIENDHIVIKHVWVVTVKKMNIKYNKINTIDVTEFLWMGWLEITVWNDKPIKFWFLQNYQEAKNIIDEKIREFQK